MKSEAYFSRESIEFKNYRFSPSSVVKNPVLLAENIRSVRLKRFPIEIELKNGETIFISTSLLPELLTFCETNNIPQLRHTDIWNSFNEPFLDTEFTEEHRKYAEQSLIDSGFSVVEIDSIRSRIKEPMLKFNSAALEWVHLGHSDTLIAIREFDSCSFNDFYFWSMEIASRHAVVLVEHSAEKKFF